MVRDRPALLVNGLGFPECPRWHGSRLWFSDFLSHRVYSADLAGELVTEWELDDRPSGLGWMPDDSLLVVSMKQRVVLRRYPDGRTTMHADLSSIATSYCNDMVVSDVGIAYVGNAGSDPLSGEPRRTAALTLIRPDGSVEGRGGGSRFPERFRDHTGRRRANCR